MSFSFVPSYFVLSGIPSFYDEHLYQCFDFIEKATDPPMPLRLNDDDEPDDYHTLIAPLKYRQWQGMPKIAAPIPQDNDNKHVEDLSELE